ncbi:MAG: phosphate ABC transporter substrate-binding protein, partial [Spirochaetota bacterium]
EPNSKLTYESVGSSHGITGVRDGVYAIGGSSKRISDAEAAAGLVQTEIAIDGIAVIVHNNIPLENIASKDLAKVFSGQITNWKALGGPDRQIFVLNRDEASGTVEAFTKLVVQKELGNAARVTTDATVVTSNGDMVLKTNSTPNSIGYCAAGYLNKVSNAKKVLVNGIEPTVENIKSFKYPISRYLYVITKGQLQAGTLADSFLKWLLSKAGQKIVEKADYIKLN